MVVNGLLGAAAHAEGHEHAACHVRVVLDAADEQLEHAGVGDHPLVARANGLAEAEPGEAQDRVPARAQAKS